MKTDATCPKCEQQTEIWSEASGNVLECSHCGHKFPNAEFVPLFVSGGLPIVPVIYPAIDREKVPPGVTFGGIFKIVFYVVVSLMIIGIVLGGCSAVFQ